MSLLDDIKKSMNSYFGGTESPTDKILGDLRKTQEIINSENATSGLVKKGIDAGLTKLAQPVQQEKSIRQADGTFIEPNDPGASNGYMGMGFSFGTIALAVGAIYFLRR